MNSPLSFWHGFKGTLGRQGDVLKLGNIEFTRLNKVSKGVTSSYHLPKGKFDQHCLYAIIYQTIRENSAMYADLEPLALQWSEKKAVSGKNVIYAEHGWLPRSTYQLSSKGCNSRSHIKFSPETDYVRIVGGHQNMQRLKRNSRLCFRDACVTETQLVDQPFFLVALQTGTDFNLLYSGTEFAQYYRQDLATAKLGQAVIDHVESTPSRFRIVFTQHPADRDNYRFNVRPENRIVYACQGVRTLDLLRHVNCRGVIAVNSNILHEALLWDKPVLALGELLAAPSVESPYSGELDSFLAMGESRDGRSELCDQYLAMLFAYQWTLTDFQNPLVLREVLKNVDALVPWETRSEYSFSV